MPELPDRPDLDQLRRQARELLRAADNGEPGAVARFRAVSDRVTLSAAQLAVAREYGCRSWAALKAEVERRPAGQPFFVTLVSEDSGAGRAAAGASVRDARTGAVTERIKPPAGEFMRVVSNGQGAFFLTASGARRASPLVYRLQVDAGGRAGQLAHGSRRSPAARGPRHRRQPGRDRPGRHGAGHDSASPVDRRGRAGGPGDRRAPHRVASRGFHQPPVAGQ